MAVEAGHGAIRRPLEQLVQGLQELSRPPESWGEFYKIQEQLKPFEDTKPVPILEFIESDRYLNMKEFVFPAGKWIVDCFYNPMEHLDECRFTHKNNSGELQEFIFPGFLHLGYEKQELQNLEFNELVIIIGQRALKSVISAIIGLYEFYKLIIMESPSKIFDGLGAGTPMHIALAATAQKQSKEGLFAYTQNWFQQAPWFSRYVQKCQNLKTPTGNPIYTNTSEQISFEHKFAYLDSVHSKAGSLRGLTRKAVIMDEICHFDEGIKNNADNVYAALSNSTETFGKHGLRVSISSPLHVSDKGMRLLAGCGYIFRSKFYEDYAFHDIEEYEGVPIEKSEFMLGFHYPTWDINPVRNLQSFSDRLKKDPENTLRDFGALPSQAEQAFFSDTAAINRMFDDDIPCPVSETGQLSDKFSPRGDIPSYFLHVDAGIGKPSNFGIALGHPEFRYNPETHQKEVFVVIDLAYAVQAKTDTGEVDLQRAREILDRIIDRFPIGCYTSDRWQDAEYQQKIKSKVRSIEKLVINIEHYNTLKVLIYDEKIKCHSASLGINRMVSPAEELKRLGLRNGIKVEKGLGYTKDIADCIAGCSYKCIHKAVQAYPRARIMQGVFSRGM